MTEPTQVGVGRINGTPASLQDATQAAATLLNNSRSAVVAGMGTDVAGARAAIALAQRIGASIDHMDADATFANLNVMRRAGWIVTTPLQTRTRADTVLLIGDVSAEWPEMNERLALNAPSTLSGTPRRVFHISFGNQNYWTGITPPPGETSPANSSSPNEPLSPPNEPSSTSTISSSTPAISSSTPTISSSTSTISSSPGLTRGPPQDSIDPAIPPPNPGAISHNHRPPSPIATLAALRAITAGRAISLDETTAAPLRQLAAALAEARFGVAIWSAATLDTLAVEMLCGLIDDLNKKTRFAGLPLAVPNQADAVTQTAAWLTGFPVRTSFAGTHPRHDLYHFNAQRLIARGEADTAIWISAFAKTPPSWDNTVPTIALVPPGTAFRNPPAVVFEIGHPGRDHDAMLYDQALGGIAFAQASTPTTIPTVAATIAAITAALAPC